MFRRAFALVLLAPLLTACWFGSTDPAAKTLANAAATAFSTGDFKNVAFDNPGVGSAFHTVVGGMLGMKREVKVDGVSGSGDSVTAKLKWTWIAGTSNWSYSTKLELKKSGTAWTAVWKPNSVEPSLNGTATLAAKRTFSARGRIIGGDGSVLVEPRAVVTIGIDLANTPAASQATSAAALATLLGINPQNYAARVAAVAGEAAKAFVPAITYRADQVPPPVGSGLAAIPGAKSVPGTLPMPPTKEFANTLLGTVGPATADIVSKSAGRVVSSDIVGVSGLQLRYDAKLAGTPAVAISRVDSTGTHQLFATAATPGQDVHLSLDPKLQQLAQSVLPNGTTAASLVAIKPSTGAVLAVADNAATGGNAFSLVGRYAPGSTFKTVTTLALLRNGLTPTTTVPCTPEVVVDGRHFPNDSFYPPSGMGNISLTTALADSCNTAFLSQRSHVGDGALPDAAAALGFGSDVDSGFPSYFGSIPTPKGETEAASDMIGQGRVSASPFAMATVISSVVAGHAVTPSLVTDQAPKARTPAHPLTADEANALRTMLRAVVATPDGTGAALNTLPGDPVIAKTGTAEFDAGGGNIETHAWMIAAQGDLAIAVVVDQGKTGASVAGPIVAAFLKGTH